MFKEGMTVWCEGSVVLIWEIKYNIKKALVGVPDWAGRPLDQWWAPIKSLTKFCE